MRTSRLVHTPVEVAPAFLADTAAHSSTAVLSNLRTLELHQLLNSAVQCVDIAMQVPAAPAVGQ